MKDRLGDHVHPVQWDIIAPVELNSHAPQALLALVAPPLIVLTLAFARLITTALMETVLHVPLDLALQLTRYY